MSHIGQCSLLSAVVIGLVGCGAAGDPNRPKTVPATVTVMYQGQPVEGATVTFQPTASQERGAVARTVTGGRAAMWSYDPNGGVLPGPYKVTISKLDVLSLPDPDTVSPEEYTRLAHQMESTLSQPPKNLLPAKYSNAATTDLTIEIVDGGDNSVTFELQD